MAVLRGGPSIDLFVEAFGMAVSIPLYRIHCFNADEELLQ